MQFDYDKAGRFHYAPTINELKQLGFTICNEEYFTENKGKVVAILGVPRGYCFYNPDKTGYKFEFEANGFYGDPNFFKIFYPYSYEILKSKIEQLT